MVTLRLLRLPIGAAIHVVGHSKSLAEGSPPAQRVEKHSAGLNSSVGDKASLRGEDTVVEIRVPVANARSVHGFMRRLGGLFDWSSVSFDGASNEIRVCSEWESRAVGHVIDTVQSWLVADGIDSATLWIGDRSYTMLRPSSSFEHTPLVQVDTGGSSRGTVGLFV